MQSIPRITIKNIQISDAAAIQHIQAACYPRALQESIDNLLAKSRLSPDSCWIALNEQHALGYLFAHPWAGSLPPTLNHPLANLPDNTDTLFLHDLAIHPHARGLGIGRTLIDQARRWASEQQLQRALLVAVCQSHAFWQRWGFIPVAEHGCQLQAKLDAYGADARFMGAEIWRWQACTQASC